MVHKGNILPDMDERFLLPLTMESFALERVGIFQFYLTLLLRILEELRQKRPIIIVLISIPLYCQTIQYLKPCTYR